MWKTLSFKKQLIVILLIPISVLLYFNIDNFYVTYTNYIRIENNLERLNIIADLSQTKNIVNDERVLYEYSKFNIAKENEFNNKVLESTTWFDNFRSLDTTMTNNILTAKKIHNKIHSNKDNRAFSSAEVYKNYTAINTILENLIDKEISNCDDIMISKLANNLRCYIDSKGAANLIRGIVLEKLIKNEIDIDLLIYYDNSKNTNKTADFKLSIFNSNGINNEIINYKNSAEFKTFLLTAEDIINERIQSTPESWWKTSTLVNNKLKKLREARIKSIVNYAEKQQNALLAKSVSIMAFFLILLLVTFLLIYNLIRNASKSLVIISDSFNKIARGHVDISQNIFGNIEFNALNESLVSLTEAVKKQIYLATKISSGIFGETIPLRSESDILNKSLNTMSIDLKQLNEEAEGNSLLEKHVIEINTIIIDSKNLPEFGPNLCNALIMHTNSCQATFYITDYIDKSDSLIKIGSYAENENTPERIKIGEGLLGEVAKLKDQKCFNNLVNEHSFLSSSLIKSNIYNVLITPILYKNTVIGIVELGSFNNFTPTNKKLLNTAKEAIGSAIAIFIRNDELRVSLEEINYKNSTLLVQEEELRQNNEELNKHTHLLQQSEKELKNQAVELEQTNAYLEEKGKELENKNQEIELKNSDLIIAHEELNTKSEEISKASKYKSEFLANMSHELRTPLNSILILSDLLKENSAGNLSNAQIDNLSVINSSGKDLLNLITDILDISKIEAGKIEIYPEKSVTERIFSDIDSLFRAQMEKKNITFNIIITDDCTREIYTDIGKIEQILKNFLSNALKFTPENGTVTITFSQPNPEHIFTSQSLAVLNSDEIIAITIKDNGIGISDANKTKLFQSFQQADSSTSRKYGGTGLGLYISKQLADLLGGEVFFDSKLNKGSTFGVLLPAQYTTAEPKDNIEDVLELNEEIKTIEIEYVNPNDEYVDLAANSNDDRKKANIEDKTILIIEDDPKFAEVLLQVAHNNGFKAIIAHQGETGFQYAKKYNPKAIILDMKLPGIDGWTVLKWLKEDKDLQHIPVHVMSGMKREKLAKEMGAFDFLIKPITPEKLKSAFQSIDDEINKVFKKVLVVEDDEKLNYSIKQLLHFNDKNIICLQAYSRLEAETILRKEEIDCAIIDLGLPDSDNIKTVAELKKISKNKEIKIIINTGKSLSQQEQLELEKSVDSIIFKTNNTTERLKDELLLFLNKIETTPENKYSAVPNLSGGEILKDRNILIVDDDIRNIYALSAALTSKGAIITTAFNGIEALTALENHPNTDIVLMDIMMPEMDGFEATRKIRENPKWRNLPIIALTAKAMKGDRDEIILAGASDYQSKPIDIQKLISLISIWIYK